jgi:hypothetical protein
MTTAFRRFVSKAGLACLAVVVAGCATPGPLTAGRLPYGSRTVAAQDPFVSQPGTTQAALASGPGHSQPVAQGEAPFQNAWDGQARPAGSGMSASGTVAPAPAPSGAHQAAYQSGSFESHPAALLPEGNPFAEPTSQIAPATTRAVEQVRYEMPVQTSPSNPFAEVEGQPAEPTVPAMREARQAPPAASVDEFLPPAF